MNRKMQGTRALRTLTLLVISAVAWSFFAYPAGKAAKPAHPEVPRIPAGELVQLLEKKADIVVVDTQSPDGYEMWHIPSAINIPYVSTEDPTLRGSGKSTRFMLFKSDPQAGAMIS